MKISIYYKSYVFTAQTVRLTMTRSILVQICFLIILIFKLPRSNLYSTKQAEAQCMPTKEAWFRKEEKTYLMNHVYERKQTGSEFACRLSCLRDESCASVNYKTSGVGKDLCELNNKITQERSKVEKIRDPEFNHHSKIKRVS